MTSQSEELVNENVPVSAHLEETEILVESIDANDQIHDDTDYSELDKLALISKAEECLHMADHKKANETLKKLREQFFVRVT